MSLFALFFYVLFGYFLAKIWKEATVYISAILINFLVPVVIFFTIIKTQKDMIYVVTSCIFCISMYLLSRFFIKKEGYPSILQVYFSYYNIGWMSIPIGIYLFGENSVPITISAYMGGIIFGSTVCLYSLNTISKDIKMSPLKKLFNAPPFIAFIIAFILKQFKGIITLNYIFLVFYNASKFMMGFLGISLL